MTLTTDRGKTFRVSFARNPTSARNRLMVAIVADERPLSQIAEDFEGVARFERTDEDGENAVFEGYTRLVSIEREGNGDVMMALERGDGA